MSDQKKLSPPGDRDERIEDAEFIEIGNSGPSTDAKNASSDYPTIGWWAEMPMLGKLLAVGALLFFCLMISDRMKAPQSPLGDARSDGEQAAAQSKPPISDGAVPNPQARDTDLTELIAPDLNPGDKFQIDSDSEAPAGTEHRCNRRATFQYYFNQERAGTFFGWFNDPDSPDVAAAESGTFHVENGHLHLNTTKAKIVVKAADGSTKESEVEESQLPIEKSAPIGIDANGMIDLGGMKFRRCNGYF